MLVQEFLITNKPCNTATILHINHLYTFSMNILPKKLYLLTFSKIQKIQRKLNICQTFVMYLSLLHLIQYWFYCFDMLRKKIISFYETKTYFLQILYAMPDGQHYFWGIFKVHQLSNTGIFICIQQYKAFSRWFVKTFNTF